MRIFQPSKCRTVHEVRETMADAVICEVCRETFASHANPPTCDACHDFLFAGWPAGVIVRDELRAAA
jgi:hypothetical protein